VTFDEAQIVADPSERCSDEAKAVADPSARHGDPNKDEEENPRWQLLISTSDLAYALTACSQASRKPCSKVFHI
jgi:hypothetical protein